MYRTNSLPVASVKESFRIFSLIIVVSMFFSPLAQISMSAQSKDDAQTFQVENVVSTTPLFEKEYLPPTQSTTSTALTGTMSKQKSLATPTATLRGRGNSGGTMPSPTPTPTNNPQWTIAGTPGVKISVNHEAWYRVTATELANAGFPVDSNRTNWQLFADAQEQPIKINTDGSIEFYGKELDTVQTDTRVYYLIYGQTAGKRIAYGSTRTSDTSNATNFDITVERRPRTYYVPAILNGDAENWFGDFVMPSQPTTQSLTVYDPDSSGTARLTVKLQGVNTGQHSINVMFNNVSVGSLNYYDYANSVVNFDVPMAAVVAGANVVSLQSGASSSDYNLIDSVSLTYKRLYEARNNRLHFSVPARKALRVADFTESNISVYEFQNGNVVSELAVNVNPEGGSYSFSMASSKSNRELMAVTASQKESPLKVEANNPSMLNSTSNNADMLIVAPPNFAQYAQTLADMRAQQGLNARVVMTDEIYDEFGYGARSVQAIKDFLKHAATYWSVKPKYVLLFGDSSYDSRSYTGTSSRNFIPTKMVDTLQYETASDTWLTDFDNDAVEDIPLGRLPAGNDAEAVQMIQKLQRYDAQGARQTKKGVFLADTYFESYSQSLANMLPNTAQSSVINRSAMSDAQMQQEIFTQGSDNPLLVVYTGHGTTRGWTSANILNVNNVGSLNNSLLGFYMVVGCLNGYSHDPNSDSLAEAILKTPNGAMGVFASSGTIAVSGPTAMSPVLTDKIFNSQPNQMLRIGDIIRLSKLNSTDLDSRRTFQLFGDPSVFVK